MDFYPHFCDFFIIITSILETQDTEVLEWAFTSLSYLYKYLWRMMVKDMDKIYRWEVPDDMSYVEINPSRLYSSFNSFVRPSKGYGSLFPPWDKNRKLWLSISQLHVYISQFRLFLSEWHVFVSQLRVINWSLWVYISQFRFSFLRIELHFTILFLLFIPQNKTSKR